LAQATAQADTAASIQTYGNLVPATYDDNGSGNFPIVTTVLSHPGTLDGYTYGNWAYLAADNTGSIDVFYSSTAAGPIANYTSGPTVGDTILAQGTYTMFDGIPELENNAVQAINVFGPGSQGNSPYYASPVLTTIPTINVGTNGHGLNAAVQGGRSLAGAYLQLNNVTISGAGANWAVHANTTGTITDSGGNSMIMFLWASSYITCGAIAASGGPVPTGLVDMTGFVDDFYNSTATVPYSYAEFVPTSITVVPEPSAMGLCGLGSALAWVCYRLRKKA
jgi:hypothetical protein